MFRGSLFGSSFDDLFRDMQREMERMDQRFEQLREKASQQNGGEGPLVYGWTMNIGPDGVPRVKRFGNTAGTQQEIEEGWREPFVTSFLDDDKDLVRITAELPGVKKENISVEAFPEHVHIEATGNERRYRTDVPVDQELDPDTADASYNNGILELTVQLAEPVTGKGTDVEIR